MCKNEINGRVLIDTNTNSRIPSLMTDRRNLENHMGTVVAEVYVIVVGTMNVT